MITIRKAGQRGHFDHGWLNTYHTFSFADYYHPEFSRFRSLRVMNEDRVAPGRGFATHGHQDMEILSYVLEGRLGHKDSLGNGSVIRAGELQCMTAGRGVLHSEMNASQSEPVHFYQIWILPRRKGLDPGYQQRLFDPRERLGKLQLAASGHGEPDTLRIHQDVRIYLGGFPQGGEVSHALEEGRHAWLQLLRGGALLNGQRLGSSDGAAISRESVLQIGASEGSEVLLFDLA